MKLEVELVYKNMPAYLQEVELDDTNLVEAKLKAADLVKKIAWYQGWKSNPRAVQVKQIF